ncbi:alpha/beta fold hydrolase [Streptococcus tangpeifui]|uniref:alpha/beta fold hydrolase n=2 Tax=Streptococcus tangpeifui TaxID=2709400 RepID=UPI001F156DB9|nr:alpha/beta hydrolase [Streptococcus sp. ZJ373]
MIIRIKESDKWNIMSEIKLMKLNNDEMYYSDTGEGIALVFLHGLGCDGRMFLQQILAFQHQYRVICPDLLGNGKSSILKVPVKQVIEKQAAAVIALLDELNIKEAVFCGTSYGGIVCQHIAVNYPNYVKGLVLTDTFSDTTIHNIKEFLNKMAISASLWLYYCRGLLKWSVKSQYKGFPEAQSYMETIMGNLRSREVVLQRRAINQINYTEKIGQLKIPILLLVGGRYNLLIDYMKRIHQVMPSSQIKVIEDSFDPSNMLKPDKYNQLLLEFLNTSI